MMKTMTMKRLHNCKSSLFLLILTLTFSISGLAYAQSEEAAIEIQEAPLCQPLSPLTPEGNATLIDSATSEDDKQFLTVTTSKDNTFYIVIDHQKTSDNVYMLSAIDEDDLMAFVSDDQASAVVEKKDQKSEKTTSEEGRDHALTSTEVLPDPVPLAQEPVERPVISGQQTYLTLGILLVAVAGLALYLQKLKKQKAKDIIPDDELEFYDDEAYVNEDEETKEDSQ